jgi:hypothetical protein
VSLQLVHVVKNEVKGFLAAISAVRTCHHGNDAVF